MIARKHHLHQRAGFPRPLNYESRCSSSQEGTAACDAARLQNPRTNHYVTLAGDVIVVYNSTSNIAVTIAQPRHFAVSHQNYRDSRHLVCSEVPKPRVSSD